MSTLTLATGGATLADRIVGRRVVTDLVLITAGAALTAGAAQIAVPLWPVPVTGQTLAVGLVGVTLGAVRGGLSMLLYALIGLAGLPVFTDASSGWGVVAGPTGGYIVGFVFAAMASGWLAQRAWDRKPLRAVAAFLTASLIPFLIGVPWLAASLGTLGLPNDLQAVLTAGFYPFLLGGLVKALLGAGIILAIWTMIDKPRNEDNPTRSTT